MAIIPFPTLVQRQQQQTQQTLQERRERYQESQELWKRLQQN